MKIYVWDNLSNAEQKRLLTRPVINNSIDLQQKVTTIINAVKQQGDTAIKNFTAEFDHAQFDNIEVVPEEISAASSQISAVEKQAILFAKKQIESVHRNHYPKNYYVETIQGVICERKATPIERVGLYVPGGTAPLISTLLMLAIPAKIANCNLRILCTPPNAAGTIDPRLLFAAACCEVTRIYKVGGAQAIAAMGYGTATVPKIDKIFGPGNAWVTAAKMQIANDTAGVAIDMPAGPSEVLIIADASANSQYTAADLLSQAEHGVDSQVILITTSTAIAEQVQAQLAQQLEKLPRAEIIKKSLSHSHIIIVETIEQAIAISNTYAPEHLILQIKDYQRYQDRISNAGTVFLGNLTAEALGDYITGSNHVLPTYGYARSVSGLSVIDFMKWINFQTVTAAGLAAIGAHAETLATMEGLTAHQRAVAIRMENQTSAITTTEFDVSKLVRRDLINFKAYSSARDEASNGKIWLNANESPYDYVTYNNVIINRYPDKQPKLVMPMLAKLYQVNTDELLLSRGSDEAIDLLIRLFCSQNQDVLIECPPTFVMYKVAAELNGVVPIGVPLTANFELDLNAIINNWSPAVKLIFLCSPNNPTGNLMKEKDILACCDYFSGKAIVIVDEAYIEYSEAMSLSRYINQYSNLVILRTLSKAYALAGARAGTLIANSSLVKLVLNIMPPYPIPQLTAACIAEMFKPERLATIKQQIEITKSERERVFLQLQSLPIITQIWPSQTNFLLIKVPDVNETMKKLLAEGIVLRNMHGKFMLEHCIRLTIGTAAENDQVIAAFEKMSSV